jgi:signal transduction histidine kinase
MRFNQRLLKIKNDFIGNMTHELKTPIATVSVALESLKSFSALDNPQRTKEYIDMAQQELNRLSILTDKVLKTAIFESNGLAFQTEKVDLEKVTSRVIDSMKLVFEKNNAKVNFVREGTTFFVNGNEDHLTNVIYNLLDNALKYSNGDPSIEVAMKVSGDNIVFSVSDHGIGIGPEHQKRIFEKFYRVPTGDVANIKGYGLGLSYVHSVVKMHGGEISVESSLNEGTTFVVNLPKLA